MMYTFIDDFIQYLNDKFHGQVPNLIYFAIGLGVGIILFLIVFLIIYLVARQKRKLKKILPRKSLENNEGYKNVISQCVDTYNKVYKTMPILDRLSGLGKLLLFQMENISKLYFPKSEDPMFEISLEQLTEFLQYITLRTNFFVDKLLEEKLHMVDVFSNYSIKDKKISVVFEMLDKGKVEEQPQKKKKSFFGLIKKKFVNLGKKVATKIGGNIMNDEFIYIIQVFGEDVNKLYSKQELKFTDLTRSEQRMLKREQRIAKRQAKKQKKEVKDDDNTSE